MRTASVLFFVATLFAAGICAAADHSSEPQSPRAEMARFENLKPLAFPTPRMYVAPHANQNFDLLPEVKSKESVCLVMHVKTVKEDDKTGVTYPVRETNCIDGSRFQLKQAIAPVK